MVSPDWSTTVVGIPFRGGSVILVSERGGFRYRFPYPRKGHKEEAISASAGCCHVGMFPGAVAAILWPQGELALSGG